jgi:O-antigen ligase
MAILFILMAELVAFTQGREAMLAFMVGCFVAAIFSPDRQVLRRVAAYIGIWAAVMAVCAALDVQFAPRQGERSISIRQFVLNATSIFTRTDSDLVDSTKEWRLNWWGDIIGYTVKGPYFWTGRGFGPNLADTDGYQTSNPEAGEAPTRSPHNATMTILARGGVPALVLWIGTLGAWLIGIARQLVEARSLGDQWWTGAFAFLLAYWMMILVASSFDVALEGPVLAVWFWTIHGIGVAALVLHRHRVATLHAGGLRLSARSA